MTNETGFSSLLPGVLIVLPLVPALLLLLIRGLALRTAVVWTGALAAAAGSIWLAAGHLSGPPLRVVFELPWLDQAVAVAGLLVSLYMLFACRGIVKREWWIPVLVVAQTVVMIVVELAGPKAECPIVVDQLSLVMALIIGIVGGLICIYALSYMEDYHHHHAEVADRKPLFFFLLFAFLSAMFGLVFSNHLGWMHFCWEVTTLCSFLLIGYSQTEEARRNAFLALGLNAIGGLSFGIAIWYQMHTGQSIELDKLTTMGTAALIPAVLIGFAGLTKSAQLPFSSWLLGAMVAPTPVSALLHSSTMVKAGVFAVMKFAPVFHGTAAGTLIALTGGVTFLVASLAAVSQSNAKLVLAYSTIANLGLVVACAGVGSPEAVWAGIMLIIFHAISKGLLFLTVGAVEHRTGSRDIEDMEGLLVTRRALGIVIIIGIVGMFLAPFGMLVAKWTCLQAFVKASPLLAVLLAFGSAPTLFFWTKWLGKVASVPGPATRVLGGLTGNEWAALGTLAVLTVGACVLFPIVSDVAIAPYLALQYAGAVVVPAGVGIMALMLGLLVLATMAFIVYPPHGRIATRYLAGANMGPAGNTFKGPLGEVTVNMRNYYLAAFFPEGKIVLVGSIISVGLMVAALAVVPRPAPAAAAETVAVEPAPAKAAPKASSKPTAVKTAPTEPTAAEGVPAEGRPVATSWLGAILFLILAPIAGGIIAGLDRIVSARMQARVGPPVLQPFYDVLKLLSKTRLLVTPFQEYYAGCFLLFAMVAGAIFFAGGDLLLCVFSLALAGVFLVLGAYAPNSPYSTIGAERELLQMMAYEPMLLVAALGCYLATGYWKVGDIYVNQVALVRVLPGVFLGLLFVLAIKLRKSPFDLSASHHAHQELVRGLTTEFSGPTLALVEVAHWYETVLLLGIVYLFFAALGPVWAAAAVIVVYGLEVLADNIFARLTWRVTVASAWIVAVVLGVANILAVPYLKP